MIKIRIERILIVLMLLLIAGVGYVCYSLYSENHKKGETLSVQDEKIKADSIKVITLQVKIDSLEGIIAYRMTSDSLAGVVIIKQKKVITSLLNELDSAKFAIDTLTAQEANEFVVGYYGVPKDSIYLGAGSGNMVATDLREHDLMERIIPIMETHIRLTESALSVKDKIIIDMREVISLKDDQIDALKDSGKQKDVNNAILKETVADLRKQVKKQKIQKYALAGAAGVLLIIAL